MKLKGRKLKAILTDGWLRVDDRPIPSQESIAQAVGEHNRLYPEMAEQGSLGGTWRDTLPIHYGGRPGYATTVPIHVEPKTEFNWTCRVKDVEGCPIVETPQIEVPLELWRAWIELAGEFSTEWMALLKGEVNADTGRARITEMYFPPQSASGAHVEIPDDVTNAAQPGTVGAVHSHVNMSAFFSSTDKDHANWPIEIVVNAKGESEANMRVKLGCGKFSRVKAKVLLVGAKAADVYRESLKRAIKPEENIRGYGMDYSTEGIYLGRGN